MCYGRLQDGRALREPLSRLHHGVVELVALLLSTNTGYVLPDFDEDRRMLAALEKGDYDTWRRRTIGEVEAAGHHELLNWHVLAGAMGYLKRKPVILDYFETFIFQSDKCFAVFPPN